MNIINPYRFATGGITDPTDIAGLELWLDAEQGVYSDAGSTLAVNNDAVQEWHDQSGNGYHVTAPSVGEKPTYITSGINSKDSVSFADDRMINSTINVSAPNTIFAVFNIAVSGTTGAVVYDSYNNVRHNFFYFNGNEYRAASVNTEDTTVTTLTADYISAVVYNGASSSIHMDGADVGDGSVDLGSNALDGISLGDLRGNPNPVAGGFSIISGQIAEIIVYDSALSAADRQAVETYLADKWGITI